MLLCSCMSRRATGTCLVLFLTVLLMMMVPLHNMTAQRASQHTLFVGSGGVITGNTDTASEVPAVTTYGGSPVVGGTGSFDPVNAVSAEALLLVKELGLEYAEPQAVMNILREGLSKLKPPLVLEDRVLKMIAANLQYQARLPSP